MWTTEKWTITGFNQKAVPNDFYKKSEGNVCLATVFPGYGYTVAAPLLFFTNALLFELGYDVLNINYEYNRNPSYLKCSESEREIWIREDISGVTSSLASRSRYSQWVFVGKSLGTTAMLHMLESHHFRNKVRLVWLTPASALSSIVDYLTNSQIESLFVVGTGDHFYDASKYSVLMALPNVRVEVIPAADHSLDVIDDVSASLRILQHTIDCIRSFLSS
jgi:hypothetical protein